MKKFFKKIWGGIKKPFSFIKRKTAPARAFMKAGRPGGMIATALVGILFTGWAIGEFLYERIPVWADYLIMTAAFVVIAEAGALLLKLFVGGSKRSAVYFWEAFFFVIMENTIGTQGGLMGPAIFMSFSLVLSSDVLGRVIWGFAKTKRFKQVFAYIALVVSGLFIGSYVYFFFNDTFGESRIAFYNSFGPESVAQVAGFDEYLKNGPYSVSSLSYGPDEEDDILTETLDYTGFDSIANRDGMDALFDPLTGYEFDKVPVKGQIWYPEGEKDSPVFFIVHGNHDSWVPSYLGYEYLGEYLASNGYVVISVDENIINATGEGNDKRAILLLDNMKKIFELNESEGSKIYGLIDEERVAIGGHSRGGEMVATAYLFNDMDVYPEDGNIKFDYHFDITSIVAISPVVDQYMPVERAVEISDVNYLLLHGSNDQDVSSMMGEKQYNNVFFSDIGNEFFLKSSVYILGANHGQFNSRWGRYDMAGVTNHYLNTYNFLDEADQKLIAKAYIRTFLDATLGEDDTYVSLLSDYRPYTDYLPDTVYITNYSDSDFVSICDFEDTSTINSFEGNVRVACYGIGTWTLDEYDRGRGTNGEDYVLSCRWKEENEPVVRIDFPYADISDGYLSFSIADMSDDTEEVGEGLKYTVELTDMMGNTVSTENTEFVYRTLAVQLYRQDAIFNSYEYKHQLQTVSISPEMFENPGEFDFKKVKTIKLYFDGSEDGSVIINNIGYWE